VREFDPKLRRSTSWVREPIVKGIGPFKRFPNNDIEVNFVIEPRAEGMVPVKELYAISR
jgi:hypothetical protein